MAVRGEVDQIPLSHILQGLLLNGQEGVLRLEGSTLKRRIRILAKGLRPLNYSREVPDLLCDVLLKQKIASESQLHNVLSTWLPGTMPAGDFLVRRGIVPPELVETKIRRRLQDFVLEVLCAPGLRYEFCPEEDAGPYELFAPEGLGQGLVFSLNSLVLEAMRRTDEWTRFRAEIPSANEVFALANRVPDLRQLEIAPETWREIRPFLNGEHSVGQIVDRTSLSEFEVYQALFRLKGANLIRPIPVDSKRALAEKLRRSLRPADAAAILRSVLEDSPDDDASRLKLVALIEKDKGSAGELVTHYLHLANRKRKENPAECESLVRRALELDGTNVAALNLLFDLKEERKDDRGALAVARSALAAARKGADKEAAIGLVYRIINFYPDETFLYHDLAAIHEERGEREAAVDCLKTAAEMHASRGDRVRARKTAERIARLDPKEAKAALETRRLRRRRTLQRRSPVAFACIAASAGAVALVPVLFGIREALARRVYAEVRAEAEVHKRFGSFERARASLRAYVERFRRSPASSEAEADLRAIDELASQAEERVRAEREGRRTKAESDYVRARLAHQANDFRRAAEILAGLDFGALDARISEEARGLRQAVDGYLRTSSSLAQLSAEAESRGDMAEAHRLRREILTKYPHSPAAQNLRLPVEIRSVPPGASVTVDGMPAGRTPIVLKLALGRPPRVRVELEGFEPVDLSAGEDGAPELNPLESYSLVAVLAKTAEWKLDARASIECVPAAVGEKICVATRGGEVILLTQDRGETVWSFRVPGGMDVAGSVGVWRGIVYFGAFDGRLYALNAETGAPIGPAAAATEELYPIKAPLSEATLDGRVVANADARVLVAWNISNQMRLWSFPSGPAAEFVGRPQIFEDRVVAATSSGEVLELDLRSGAERRRLKVATHLSFGGSIGSGRYYLGTTEGAALAIDLASGKVEWTLDIGEGVAAPLSSNADSVLVPLSSGSLLSISADGRIRWRSAIDDTVASTFESAAAGDRFYVGTRRGWLLGVDAATGAIVWRFRTEGAALKDPRGILAGPSIADGRLFFGSEDHFLYCLRIGL